MLDKCGLWLGLCCAIATGASAQEIPRERIKTLPALLDAKIPPLMQERHVVGASIAVVHNGRVVYLRGHGVPSLGAATAVDPALTAFRIGSASKLFTAIAALQLVEAGTLDLQRNIADYLPELPLRYSTTTHQLLTHTAGFDERFAGAYTESATLPTLSDHLRLSPPQQVIPPGAVYSYSNYNYAVAGAVVERLSGKRFEQYLADRVLAPRWMTATTAYQPPPSAASSVASSYRWNGSVHEPLPRRFTFASPSGGVTTSAADMASLMIAILEDGDDGGEQILSAASKKLLLGSHYSPHPRIPSAAYGSVHWKTRGKDLIFKDGTLGDQIGVIVLDPPAHFGVFLASNTLPGVAVLEPLLDHVYGTAPAAGPTVPMAGAAARASRYQGTFRDFHHTRNDMSRLFALTPMIQTRVTADADGAIQWRGRKWIEIEPLLFQSADGKDHIVFREDATGAITELHAWGSTHERIGPFEQAPFHIGVVTLSLLVCVVYVLRGLMRRQAPDGAATSVFARRLGIAVGIVNLVFAAGFVGFFRDSGVAVPLPVVVVLWLSLGIVSLVLTAIVWILVVAAWRHAWWTRGERIGYSALAVAAASFITFLNYWKLLGFRY